MVSACDGENQYSRSPDCSVTTGGLDNERFQGDMYTTNDVSPTTYDLNLTLAV